MPVDPKDAQVILEEEGTVTIDLSDNPELAATLDNLPEIEEPVVKDPLVAERKPRERLNTQQAVKPPAVDEATQALTAAREKADRDVAAANATASAERSARLAAERVAAQRTQEADDARTSAESAQLQIIENGITATTGEVGALQSALADAHEKGDFKAVADVQVKLGKATARLDRLESQKEDFATRKVEPRTEQSQPQQLNAFEQYLSNFTPEAQSWLRAHPDCVPAAVGGNSTANAKMMAGHYAALSQNVQTNTQDYFRIIEEHTGHRQPVSRAADTRAAGDEETEQRPAPRTPAARRAQPSAPPSRDPPAANGTQPRSQRTVTLSKDQQEAARLSFPTMEPQKAYATYARNLIELEAEGKIGRVTH